MKITAIIHKSIYVVALLVVTTTSLIAQTGLEIMTKNDQQIFANDEKYEITMTLINKKGKSRVRELKQVSQKDEAKNRSTLLTFLSPADVKGTGFLSIEHTAAEDDQWLFLPALKRSRRISASDKTDNFMGSDFTYEDLDTEDLENFNYKLNGEEVLNDIKHYIIEATPKNVKKEKESGYGKRIIYVRYDNHIISKIKFFDKKGTFFKEMTASNIRKIDNSEKWRAFKREVHNVKTGHKTILDFKNIVIDTGVEEDQFTKRNLERSL
ncbi:outer membrane lipoprotein-sorting protein [Aquimarina sp. 2201CG5-10]|uniref:outer membrane lipoprotein-sorting protein n=1 Tax=Aquimarina callyspongiae TaxID=3098150 RepID=UPI002AB58D1B|nr:outer membrane lipoprotein-sorting protein [Aquimarina sp. 2201CG5-10]MDY8138350.1 outer membrane lipoprotein-sorting protein [Aquimarina sp. 2201CG5-10]